jgi:hypothetical protein
MECYNVTAGVADGEGHRSTRFAYSMENSMDCEFYSPFRNKKRSQVPRVCVVLRFCLLMLHPCAFFISVGLTQFIFLKLRFRKSFVIQRSSPFMLLLFCLHSSA